MAKKFGKVLAGAVLLGTAVLGGIACYKKWKKDSNSLDDDFDDFQDEFDEDDFDEDEELKEQEAEDEKEELENDFSSVNRGYVTIPKDHPEETESSEEKSDEISESYSAVQAEEGSDGESFNDEDAVLSDSGEEDDEEDMLDDPDPDENLNSKSEE